MYRRNSSGVPPKARDRLRGERLGDFIRLERLIGGARELVDDRLRRAGGRHQPEPQDRYEVGFGFVHGGKIGHERGAVGIGYGEGDQRAGAHVLHRRGRG